MDENGFFLIDNHGFKITGLSDFSHFLTEVSGLVLVSSKYPRP